MAAFQVTILAEDTAGPRGTIGEHGLAVWMETDGHVVLFDTGQGLALRRNAAILGLDLSRIEAIAISHGHYDHTGGLSDALGLSPDARFFLHPDALDRKYRLYHTGSACEIGVPPLPASALRRASVRREGGEIHPGVWMTGEIPRLAPFENAEGHFYRDSLCTNPDPVLDDQALFFQASKGIVVVLGCAHAGVIDTLEYVRNQNPGSRIHAILGGMHLLDASALRIRRTIAALERFEIDVFCPCHCTGAGAIHALRSRFGDRVRDCRTGSRLAFD